MRKWKTIEKVNENTAKRPQLDDKNKVTSILEARKDTLKTFSHADVSFSDHFDKDKVVEVSDNCKARYYSTQSSDCAVEPDIGDKEVQSMLHWRLNRMNRPPTRLHNLFVSLVEDSVNCEQIMKSLE